MPTLKTICVNAKNKPNEIPNSHWVVEEREYTIIHIAWLESVKDFGVKLEEIDLKPFFPYKFFMAKRFNITKEQIIDWFNELDNPEPTEEELVLTEELEEELV